MILNEVFIFGELDWNQHEEVFYRQRKEWRPGPWSWRAKGMKRSNRKRCHLPPEQLRAPPINQTSAFYSLSLSSVQYSPRKSNAISTSHHLVEHIFLIDEVASALHQAQKAAQVRRPRRQGFFGAHFRRKGHEPSRPVNLGHHLQKTHVHGSEDQFKHFEIHKQQEASPSKRYHAVYEAEL